MLTSIIGFPRVGNLRELKFATEKYFKHQISQERLQTVAKEIREKCEVFLVCGIGGSYLGARAVIEMVNGVYNDAKPEIIFIGNQ